VAALDWAMLETLIAAGVTPVAAPELVQFRKVAVEPAIPAEVADLGLRGSPNFEMLRLCNPTLVVSSPWYAATARRVESFAPVVSYSLFEPGRPPFAPALEITRQLAAQLGRSDGAEQYVADTERLIQDTREVLAALTAAPVFLISLGDARHFRVFGRDSMFGDVLQRLGFMNAWSHNTGYAATAPLPIEALASVPEARVVALGPTPPGAMETLRVSQLWNALPAVAQKRVIFLPSLNHFGSLPSARRFVRLFCEALLTRVQHS
jgi:iron complex transport system substrate-binding protein